MSINKHLIIIIALIIGFSMVIGTVSATDTGTTVKKTYNKKLSVDSIFMKDKYVNGKKYSYYTDGYVKITLGPPYKNGAVYTRDGPTGKYYLAKATGRNVMITPLKKNVKVKTIYLKSIKCPTYAFKTDKYNGLMVNRWIKPGYLRTFFLFTVYYTVTK